MFEEITLDFDVHWGALSEGGYAEAPLRTLSIDGLISELNVLPNSIKELVIDGLSEEVKNSIFINNQL